MIAEKAAQYPNTNLRSASPCGTRHESAPFRASLYFDRRDGAGGSGAELAADFSGFRPHCFRFRNQRDPDVFRDFYFYFQVRQMGGSRALSPDVGARPLGYALTLIGLATATRVSVVWGLRFCEGVALSAIFVADFALGRLSPPTERGRWLSYYGVALSLGLLMGPAFSLMMKVSTAIGVVAAVSFFCGIVAFKYRIDSQPESAEPLPLAKGALCAGAAHGFMEAGVVGVFPVFALMDFGVRPEYCLVTMIGFAGVSSLLWGWLSDRGGPEKIVTLLLGGLSGFSFLLIFTKISRPRGLSPTQRLIRDGRGRTLSRRVFLASERITGVGGMDMPPGHLLGPTVWVHCSGH